MGDPPVSHNGWMQKVPPPQSYAELATILREQLHDLPKGQQRIATVLLSDPESTAFRTIAQTAEAAEVHQSSLVRFATSQIGRASCRERVWISARAEDGIRDRNVTAVQTCALPISPPQSYAELATILREQLHDLPKGQQRIATVLLSDPESTAFRTIAQTAEAAEVHQSSLVRFATSLGLKGYPALVALCREHLSD